MGSIGVKTLEDVVAAVITDTHYAWISQLEVRLQWLAMPTISIACHERLSVCVCTDDPDHNPRNTH